MEALKTKAERFWAKNSEERSFESEERSLESEERSFEALFPHGTVITLQSALSGYWANVKNNGLEPHTEIWTAINGKCPASRWIVEHFEGQVCFKSAHSGHYINVKNDGGFHAPLWTCATNSPAASRWTPVPRGDDQWAFESHTGHFMNVQNDGMNAAHDPLVRGERSVPSVMLEGSRRIAVRPGMGCGRGRSLRR
eukprot:CAMPEP_0197892936 /NCGR_PEP_ID=MMETSP1439-20131203/32108_1 /TAXON_ID=66791 /ORGANISM="Gonyaulax spinifera, Strain CCMP409" /LENGTH=195 /DNA_ID=CAMNT_0043513157 /DNA_START=63 /DNA_END=649 /DNA_ORIENTATION=+